jgi:hypothetical protein
MAFSSELALNVVKVSSAIGIQIKNQCSLGREKKDPPSVMPATKP